MIDLRQNMRILMDQSKLFFIMGLGRGGTSIFQEIMNTFDGFDNIGESRIGGQDGMSCYAYVIKNNDFSYLDNYILSTWTSKYYVEKTPNSLLCLPQIAKHYPNANFLFLERNPYLTLLSVMNMHSPGIKDEKKRKYDIEAGNITPEELSLNYEQHRAKQILKMVEAQVCHKKLFQNQMCIRYETLVKEPELIIDKIAKKFKLISNIALVKQILSRPSYSSMQNTYEIKKLIDQEAINMIRKACHLWDYEF
jgi:hypothetical protein